ncbi:MAG: thiamine pyrophosphate-binding protein [Deltaproteobacteria bacterium]|jgi:acetolactate synthase-1/2/3 large subunit|nr:thiamine pyrophosphate-binding protein [Deltaproteobacteria bacterium]
MQTIRLADYVTTFLADFGVDTAFMLTGGFAMHLNDALAQESRINKICCHHEQACALAAEAYAHVRHRPALVQITAGPGVTNALTGVYSAFVDGLPMLVICGQVKRELLRAARSLENLRQIGEQEVDSVALARPVTKYAQRILEPEHVKYELGKALYIASAGRPGPVWLEIPLDVQAALIEPAGLPSFRLPLLPPPDLSGIAASVARKLERAKRPLLVAGPDLHMDEATDDFLRLAEKCAWPVVCAGVLDIVQREHPLYAGAMGAVGNRAGNIAMQNADVILFLGVAMHTTFTTYNWQAMGRNAHKIVVEPEFSECERPQWLGDESIICRPGEFIRALDKELATLQNTAGTSWLDFCRERVRLLPPVPERLRSITPEGRINPYWFAEELFKRLGNADIVTPGNATAGITAQQAGSLRPGQRLLANFGCGPMGYALPAATGAAVAGKGRRVICLDGDGSFMLNMQELATIKYHKLPIIIFIYNNNGYASIRQSQQNFFTARLGYGPENGLCFPDFVAVAQAFGLPAIKINGRNFQSALELVLQKRGPFLAEVLLDAEQGFEPKIASRKLPDGRMASIPPENMHPFLSEEELQTHLLCKL